jgi:putative endopeptidase
MLYAMACATPPAAVAPKPAEPPTAAAARTVHGLDLAGIDASVRPGDDFFRYANGTWLATTEIPADHNRWGTGAIVAERTAKRTADLIAEAAKGDAPAGSDARKVGDYYATVLDEAAIEAKGVAPLQPVLAEIAAISDRGGLARALGASLRADVDVLNAGNVYTPNLFGLWVAQDLTDPSRYSPFLLQGGLGLYEREYYLDPSPRMAEAREKYRAYLATLFGLAGVPDAAAKAARVFALEVEIAKVHAARADSFDVRKGNNRWTRRELEARARGLDWGRFLGAAQLDKQPEFIVWQPEAVAGLAALVKSQPLEAWKDFLLAHAIHERAFFLPKAFGEARFALYGRALRGTPQPPERWKRAVNATSEALGMAVGRLYVERYFPASEKARAEAMVRNVVAAFAKRLDALPWMAPETKARAKAKLAALKVGVGYPDTWPDYAGLEVVRGDAYGNADRASRFEYRRNLAKLGRPVDRGEWDLDPHEFNAANLPAMNALNFPAAILQPPDFDPSRPAAMDYGSFGMTIGHELCHGFDDTGAQFDEAGKLSDWWTEGDYAHFRASSAKLVEQFDAYQPFADAHVNGKQTLSENIADAAGLAVAYDAYRLSLGGGEAKAVGGLSGDQQFFLSFAQSWRMKAREPALRQQVLLDGHSPEEYRVDTVRNVDAWYAAFDVRPGQALYLAPGDRTRVY